MSFGTVLRILFSKPVYPGDPFTRIEAHLHPDKFFLIPDPPVQWNDDGYDAARAIGIDGETIAAAQRRAMMVKP